MLCIQWQIVQGLCFQHLIEAHTSSTGGAPVLVHGSLYRYMAFHVVPAEVSKKKEVPDFAPEVPGFGQVKVSGFVLQVPGFVHL